MDGEDINIARAVVAVKRAHKKLVKTFDGDSNDAEHDAAVVLTRALDELYSALGVS